MTKAPWEYRYTSVCTHPHSVFAGDTSVVHTPWDRPGEADLMRGIAFLRNHLPAIAEALERQRQPRLKDEDDIAEQFEKDNPHLFERGNP